MRHASHLSIGSFFTFFSPISYWVICNFSLRVLASGDVKKCLFCMLKTSFYLFYYLILQLTQQHNFYFYIQLIKIM